MEGFVDHYIVLGLPSREEALKLGEKEISKAYRSKALDLHPDKRPDDSEAHENFQRLKTSYEVLKDEKAQKLFDDLLRIKREKEQKKSQVDSKRRKMMSDLEERERSAFAPNSAEYSARISLRKKGARAKSSGTAAASENINGKRKRKKIVNSSEGEHVATGGQHSRRSVRSKQHVSYKESDDVNKEENAESAKMSDFIKKSHDSGACNAAKGSSSRSTSEVEIFEMSKGNRFLKMAIFGRYMTVWGCLDIMLSSEQS